MEKSSETKTIIEKAGEDLFNFAVDREDVKLLMAGLHESADIKRNAVEYELQILKIISVGWAISYYLENYPQKDLIGKAYWQAVQNFSQNLSETFGLFVSQSIDYFQILKDRLETYVNALKQKPGAPEPAAVIAPEFASLCGNKNDVFTMLIGSKMFISTIGCVKEYIESLGIKQTM